jgi:hypothetical protein
MRCARCDRLVVPQATGWTREGQLVFGWCVSCLEETDCRDIRVAKQIGRKHRFRARSRPLHPEVRHVQTRPARTPMDDRRQVVSAVALVMALWGIALTIVGLVLSVRHDPSKAGRLGNSTPSLLIGGGGSTAAVGLALWGIITGPSLLRSRVALKVIQGVAFVVAMAALIAGIALRTPRLDPLVIGVTSTALAVSVAARWLEIRRFPPVAMKA